MRYGSKFMMIPVSHLKQITLLVVVRKIFWAMSFQNGGLVATLDFGLSGWGYPIDWHDATLPRLIT